MEKYKKYVGNLGESYAERYLRKNKYKILDKNYYIRGGEIDIIAFKDGYTIFVEVKTRTDSSYGTGAEAITYNKKQRLIKAAQNYLLDKGEIDVRFDVIEVFAKTNNDKVSLCGINHIKNAF